MRAASPGRRTLAPFAVVATVLLVASSFAPDAARPSATEPFRTGLMDDGYPTDNPHTFKDKYDRAGEAGASVARVAVLWARVAPRPPAGRADDPFNRAYDWSYVDDAVREAGGRGLDVLLTIVSAPRWAEGARRPRSAPAGSWRPDPSAFGAFAGAVARRYSGRSPDPSRPGEFLPRVRYFQAWNEPNLRLYLSPQWVSRSKRLEPASPARYRRMLNAFYSAVKRVSAANVVVTAGTAPYGDTFPRDRIRPGRFMRELLCLRGLRLRRLRCPRPARFDIFAHHPYAVGGPRHRAYHHDDIAIPDLHRLSRVVRRAVRTGRALPRRAKPLWITEFGWDSSPPDPDGVRNSVHAYWLQHALYVFWRQGAKAAVWLHLRDQTPSPSFRATSQSGLLFADGTPKLAYRAFRFPFYARRLSSGRVLVWGSPPPSTSVTLQRRVAGEWRTARALTLRSDGTFRTLLAAPRRALLRAEADGVVSLGYRL